VYRLKNPSPRREFFEACVAYVDAGAVWIRFKKPGFGMCAFAF
jgi:hypothetical protein